MSPRAAWRLESLGFGAVFDYTAGLADWMGAGLPIEGSTAREARIGDVARQDVPTCGPGERVGAVAERVRAAGWNTCLVVNERGVILGRLYTEELEGDPKRTAEAAMRAGPSTYRPDVAVAEMLERMEEEGLDTAPVTRSDGTLVGLVLREDLRKLVGHRHVA
ncbi:MAG: CBS domain-containing protein [Candidatus Limnocylindria bacterium]